MTAFTGMLCRECSAGAAIPGMLCRGYQAGAAMQGLAGNAVPGLTYQSYHVAKRISRRERLSAVLSCRGWNRGILV